MLLCVELQVLQLGMELGMASLVSSAKELMLQRTWKGSHLRELQAAAVQLLASDSAQGVVTWLCSAASSAVSQLQV